MINKKMFLLLSLLFVGVSAKASTASALFSAAVDYYHIGGEMTITIKSDCSADRFTDLDVVVTDPGGKVFETVSYFSVTPTTIMVSNGFPAYTYTSDCEYRLVIPNLKKGNYDFGLAASNSKSLLSPVEVTLEVDHWEWVKFEFTDSGIIEAPQDPIVPPSVPVAIEVGECYDGDSLVVNFDLYEYTSGGVSLDSFYLYNVDSGEYVAELWVDEWTQYTTEYYEGDFDGWYYDGGFTRSGSTWNGSIEWCIYIAEDANYEIHYGAGDEYDCLIAVSGDSAHVDIGGDDDPSVGIDWDTDREFFLDWYID